MLVLDTILFYMLCLIVMAFLTYKICGQLSIGKLHEKYVFITGKSTFHRVFKTLLTGN